MVSDCEELAGVIVLNTLPEESPLSTIKIIKVTREQYQSGSRIALDKDLRIGFVK